MMDRSSGAAPVAAGSPATAALLPWKAPRLVRMGTVEALTSKIDMKGKNDGGSGSMKRT
jgi:hypothetical protein